MIKNKKYFFFNFFLELMTKEDKFYIIRKFKRKIEKSKIKKYLKREVIEFIKIEKIRNVYIFSFRFFFLNF